MEFKTKSNLAVLLLKCFAKGELPATRVADLAKAAYDDGWGRADPLARDLAQAGLGGKGHALERVVYAAKCAGFMSTAAQPYICKVPGPKGELIDLMMFLPHEIYYALIESTHGQVHPWCLPPGVAAMETGLGKTLRDWCAHSDVAITDDPTGIGILGLHTDGATYTRSNRAGSTKSVVVASCNVISARDPRHRSKRHFLYCRSKSRLCDCGCGGYHTYQAIHEVISWSMRCMARGVWPSRRHDDSPWSELDRKHRMSPATPLPKAALLQLRGDWEWMTQCFRFRTAGQDRFCWMCEACKAAGPNCYLDMRPNAPHRATCISHQQYIQACIREAQEPSTIFRVPGFQIDYATVDAMHAGDSGVFPDAVGSIFWLYIRNKNRYRNTTLGLNSLNRQLQQYYTANRAMKLTKVSPLVYSQIKATKPGYPYLKTSAAGCRHVTDFALAIAYGFKDGGDGYRPLTFHSNHRLHGREAEHNQIIVDMMEGLVSYQRAASMEPFDVNSSKTSMYGFLNSFIRLHQMWREGLAADDPERATLPFHARPKAHLLQHLVEEKIQLFGSPNSFHCYMDEDFVGVVKGVCAASKHPATLERRVSEKCQIMAGVTAWEVLAFL